MEIREDGLGGRRSVGAVREALEALFFPDRPGSAGRTARPHALPAGAKAADGGTDFGYKRRMKRYSSVRFVLRAAGLAILAAVAGPAVAAEPAAAPKWHPGHYVFVGHGAIGAGQVLPHFRGVQKCYAWKTLEPEKGRYDFSAVRADLDFLAKHDRYLVLQLQYKAFGKDANYTPDYVRGPDYGGGIYRASSGSFNPVIWNAAVGARLDALVAALGRAFDRDPHFEAVVLPETAPSAPLPRQPQPGVEAYTDGIYLEALRARLRALREAFPGTVLIQYCNFPPAILPGLAETMKETGVGIGGPDVYILPSNHMTPGKGVYTFYPPLSGIAPLGAAVQSPDYSVAQKKRTAAFDAGRDPKAVAVDPKDEEPFPPGEIFRFARDRLKLNYLFWSASPRACFRNVQQWMESDDFPKDAAGGLDARCPERAFAR